MAPNDTQANQLLQKLLARTQARGLAWERSVEPKKYQARMGEFVMQIGPDAGGVSLVVRRLSGAVIETFTTSPVLKLSMTGGVLGGSLSAQNKALLEGLYSLVADNNDELDELIRLL